MTTSGPFIRITLAARPTLCGVQDCHTGIEDIERVDTNFDIFLCCEYELVNSQSTNLDFYSGLGLSSKNYC